MKKILLGQYKGFYKANLHCHTTCSDGFSDPAKIESFLTEIRSQKSPQESGVLDLIRQPNGVLTNCYLYGKIIYE